MVQINNSTVWYTWQPVRQNSINRVSITLKAVIGLLFTELPRKTPEQSSVTGFSMNEFALCLELTKVQGLVSKPGQGISLVSLSVCLCLSCLSIFGCHVSLMSSCQVSLVCLCLSLCLIVCHVYMSHLRWRQTYLTDRYHLLLAYWVHPQNKREHCSQSP